MSAFKLRSKLNQLIVPHDLMSNIRPYYKDVMNVYSHSDGTITGTTLSTLNKKIKVAYNNSKGYWEYTPVTTIRS